MHDRRRATAIANCPAQPPRVLMTDFVAGLGVEALIGLVGCCFGKHQRLSGFQRSKGRNAVSRGQAFGFR